MSAYYYFKMKLDVDIKNNVSENAKKKMEDKIRKVLEDMSKICVAKMSIAKKPLFCSNEYFRTYEELERFYEENKDNITIVDNYGIVFSYEKFKNEVDFFQNQNFVRSNKECGTYCVIDNKGYEFSSNITIN